MICRICQTFPPPNTVQYRNNTYDTLCWQQCRYNTEHTWHTGLAVMQTQYRTYIYKTQLSHTTFYTDSIQSSYNTVKKHKTHDTHIIHNIRHTIPNLNNSCTTFTLYNTSQKYSTVYTIHNTYTDNITQQMKNTIQHKTCRAECTSSSVNVIYDLYSTISQQQFK